jgi:hypothetical protein
MKIKTIPKQITAKMTTQIYTPNFKRTKKK